MTQTMDLNLDPILLIFTALHTLNPKPCCAAGCSSVQEELRVRTAQCLRRKRSSAH